MKNRSITSITLGLVAVLSMLTGRGLAGHHRRHRRPRLVAREVACHMPSLMACAKVLSAMSINDRALMPTWHARRFSPRPGRELPEAPHG